MFSKYNIFSQIRNSSNYFIVNLLSGNADILTPDEAQQIISIKNGLPVKDLDFLNLLTENGYWTDAATEKKLFNSKYLDFVDSRDSDEIQIFFVPNYSCNFACSYCYQDEYTNSTQQLDTLIIDSFFRYIESEFSGRRKYLTVFGGEPLLNSSKQKELISYFLLKAKQADLEVCFVTNGYTLNAYIPILNTASIREIQVTLDGTAYTHDKRRFLKNGSSTFDKIVHGIDSCLASNIPINLRMVIDSGNIDNLPEFARFAINKGWTKSPFFKTQIGRNYELHHCQSASEKLFTRISLYEKIYELTRTNPEITEFYKPAYSISRFLFENGELPEPLFDSCPACKTEWAFDYTGSIYSCTATVGKANEKLGTFYPEKSMAREIVDEWQKRDVISIEECKTCNVQLACGGGCGSVAKNRTGKICSTDCRPITELIELGFSEYYEK